MKKYRKILVSVLAAVMMLLQTPMAFAADSNKITINNAGDNHIFTAYQVFAGDISNKELTGIKWGAEAGDATDLYAALQKATWKTAPDSLSKLNAASSAAAFAKVFSEIASDSTDAKTLGNILGSWVKGDGRTSSESKAPYQIGNLADGYYLVKDRVTKQTEDDFISDYMVSIVKDVTMNVKGSIPEIKKTISDGKNFILEETSAQIGDIIRFQLDGTLPSNFDDYDKYMLAFNDQPTSNLAVDKDSIKVFAGEVQVSERDYTVSQQGVTVTVADVKKLHDSKGNDISVNKDSHIYVTYEAELVSGITPGTDETNTAYLTYSNDPHGDGQGFTTPDDVVVHVYSVEFVKTDGATHELISGAAFRLYAQQQGGEAIKLVKISDTEYKLADSDDTNVITDIAVADKTAGIIIKGLKKGTYYLEETVVPVGYNIPDSRFEVNAGPQSTNSKVAVKDGIYQEGGIEIQNNSGTELPSTGGSGSRLFMLLGSAAAIIAALFLVTNQRMRKEEF